jgi:hypothetical protein
MALAIHPYICGQPHRIKYLEAIYDYVSASTACCTGTASQILRLVSRGGEVRQAFHAPSRRCRQRGSALISNALSPPRQFRNLGKAPAPPHPGRKAPSFPLFKYPTPPAC